MKKFVALVVLLCTVMFSSTVAAENYFSTSSSQFLCMTWEEANAEREKSHMTYADMYQYVYSTNTEQERLKKEREAEETREEEFYALVATVTLTVVIIVAVFAYEYFKNRQAVKERSLSTWLSFIDGKNFWIFIFCVVSLVTCLIYTPYNLVNINHPHIINNTSHATIFDVPKHFEPKSTRIDYETIAFREVLILIGCCAGYTAMKVIKKH